jgi:PTH1 family peptidyl-tRNA hydrolase
LQIGEVRIALARNESGTDGVLMIVGLGNPGKRYARSRHNVGFEVAGEFSRRHAIRFRRKRKLGADVGVGQAFGRRIVAVMPTTFMNRSGQAVASAVGFYGVAPRNVLVVVDDVNLPLGQLRIRRKGSDGGHNGLRSVIACLGTMEFPRLRVGIGTAGGGSLTDFVLGDFSAKEERIIKEAIERATEAVGVFVAEGAAAAMNRYNEGGERCREEGEAIEERQEEKNTIKIDEEAC